ncbi:MAG: hypothetical protein SF123_17680 [Chloroflexota bacterium]|nr:hypothetical protein [Chloroflexota bacterium]
MSIEGLIIGFILVSIVVVIVAAPLLGREGRFDAQAAQLARQRERAHVYYERVLRNLRDLDEDHALGKLDDDAYEADRALWAERGVQVLKALDQLSAGTMIAPPSADDAAIDRSLDDAVEAAVRAYRQGAG